MWESASTVYKQRIHTELRIVSYKILRHVNKDSEEKFDSLGVVKLVFYFPRRHEAGVGEAA